MTDAATKNTAELKVPCNGVDFQALENKDVGYFSVRLMGKRG